MNTLRLKSRIVGSPLEPIFRGARIAIKERRANLEVADVILEDRRLPEILARLLKPSSNIIDVGGHIGSFISPARQIAPQGKHTIIEASPTKASWLRSKFPDCRVENVAVSDREGSALFYEDPNRPGFSRLTTETGPHSYEVKTTTLDNLSLGQVDLLKIDVEGFELQVLKGAAATIEESRPPIIFECGCDEGGIHDRRALFDHFESIDYAVHSFVDFLYNKGPLSFDEFRKCGVWPFRAFNFVATPHRA